MADEIKTLKPLDVIACNWLHHEGPNVVIPHQQRGLLLVPLSMVVENDNAQFEKTHKRAAYRSVDALDKDGRDWHLVGRLEQKWSVSGPRRI